MPGDSTAAYNRVYRPFKPTVETYCSEKKIHFKMRLLVDSVTGQPRARTETDSEINVVFVPADTSSVLPLTDQGVISTFESYQLTHIS